MGRPRLVSMRQGDKSNDEDEGVAALKKIMTRS